MKDVVRRVNLVLGVLCAAYFVMDVTRVVLGRKQWDFTMRYAAARAYQSGLDPYQRSNLESVMGRPVTLPYVYPPLVLKASAAAGRLEERTAYLAHLLVKLLALAWVIHLWRRVAPDHTGDVGLLVMYVVVGFQETVLRDIRAGNISLFEQALLWTSVCLLLKNQVARFGVGVGIAAGAKQLPVAWLGLAAAQGGKAAVRAAAAGVLVWGSLLLGSWLTEPVMFREFLANATTGLVERGRINPSSLALLLDAADLVGVGSRAAYVGWGLWVVVVGLVCVWLWRSGRLRGQPLLSVALGLAAYTLVAPRMKDYSYIVMLLPALVLIPFAFERALSRGAMHLLVLAGFLSYNSLLTTGILFGTAATRLRAPGGPPAG